MDATTQEEVRLRSAGRCEYCHLPEAHVVTPFHVEHIIPKQHGGPDTLSNLAYACLRCNLHKGPNLTGIDAVTRKITPLFNPRRHKWERHFGWEKAALIGKTAIGRTTVDVLAINDRDRVALRQELLDQGLFPQE
jgi:5-methylcytosine-specific restriction endonuclease McrA